MALNLLMSDVPINVTLPDEAENRYIDLSQKKISNCVGCFGCWVKTPGKCVIRDDAVSIYPLIAQSSKVIYVSKICYGSYDIVMKTMLERALPVQQAFIRLYQRETHHFQRNVAEKEAVIIAYGDLSEESRELFQRLIARNSKNMAFKKWEIFFVSENEVENTVQREVDKWKK